MRCGWDRLGQIRENQSKNHRYRKVREIIKYKKKTGTEKNGTEKTGVDPAPVFFFLEVLEGFLYGSMV